MSDDRIMHDLTIDAIFVDSIWYKLN